MFSLPAVTVLSKIDVDRDSHGKMGKFAFEV